MKTIIKFIKDTLVSLQKAQVAAYFARTGRQDSARSLMLKD